MIRVILGEDQQMLRSALATLLSLEGDIEVVGQAENGKVALELIEELHPDIAVLDIEMPLMTGLDVADAVKKKGWACRIIMLTTFARSGYLQRAMASSVGGYLLKDSPSDELSDAIRKVYAGKRVMSPELTLAAWEDPCPLSPREKEVLKLAEEGQSMQDISAKLFLSYGTVRNYMSDALSKVGAGTRIEAIRIAREKGWLD
ncbi:response regulator transcription factor [Paenibacillus alvei]|uniref:Response regulator transcription factor n=1 Tax=Paenibacillus alvei TaxID=44250 RepID=A0AAP7A410_PAEAL|nr:MULTISPECIES: response regulator transcription factor [Paenibacillus]EJW18935.1 putative transcriptional regulatory protein YvfU [Paenibacillus alvei DSM 29]MBG9732763.1 transcriptional regulator [Paenibacillus alvei]MBG9744168.1 transcriptional regulator [Paenibacillus alvei]MCY7487213.1 response regulator transcription factor [Paenibacillus alvei]MCY9539292.1 response regulator transcription factor [Paenibacillus alvei]